MISRNRTTPALVSSLCQSLCCTPGTAHTGLMEASVIMLDFMNDLLIDIDLEQNKHTQMQQVVHNRAVKNIKVPFLLLMHLNHFLRDVIV